MRIIYSFVFRGHSSVGRAQRSRVFSFYVIPPSDNLNDTLAFLFQNAYNLLVRFSGP
jgi:hypothetical protein